MATGFEAVRDAMTGGLAARAVEPAHGEASADAHGRCLNCQTELIGAHCHNCGQKAHVHRTMHEYAHDLLHSVFHFEGKVWRTLPMLAVRPGELTRRYIHGERAKFVSPLALFLFAVFLMFAIVGSLAGETEGGPALASQSRTEAVTQLEKEIATAEAKRKALATQIDAAQGNVRARAALEGEQAKLAEDLQAMHTARLLSKDGKAVIEGTLKTGWPWLDRSFKKANSNPSLLLYKLQSSAYKYSWALIPLSLPFLWLLFAWRREFKLYDHAVFVTYSITFMLFFVVLLTVLGYVGIHEGFLVVSALVIPPLHMHKQLRGAYRVGRIGGLVRTAILTLCAAIVLVAFVALLLALGLLG